MSRHATTERVSITLHTVGAGIAVLRESYMKGLRATVDGHSVTTLPVDGGLWTAVPVGKGTSRVVLDYATTADLVEFAAGAVGLAALALLWVALGVSDVRRRRRRSRSASGEDQTAPPSRTSDRDLALDAPSGPVTSL